MAPDSEGRVAVDVSPPCHRKHGGQCYARQLRVRRPPPAFATVEDKERLRLVAAQQARMFGSVAPSEKGTSAQVERDALPVIGGI
jgi:hypothetical protein